MVLVLSAGLDQLYRRRSDQAWIVECDQQFHKKFMVKGEKFVVVRREDGGEEGLTGLEKQYTWHCKEC